jgi:hypothetical protein
MRTIDVLIGLLRMSMRMNQRDNFKQLLLRTAVILHAGYPYV